MDTASTIEQLAADVIAGNRRALAQALSLIESTTQSDKTQAAMLLSVLAKRKPTTTRRICVTGAPGVGKSTLLERFGLDLIEQGARVAVLPIDPSSKRSGGSILGDKVRMPGLALHEDAFIRPSPSRSTLGGTTETTRDAILLCEAAGFDTVIVETVGVGQSEMEAASMVDMFVLLVLPTAGDDVQGIKRGIMEVADVVVVTKADLSDEAAQRARALYHSSLHLMLPSRVNWESSVVVVSAVRKDGLDQLHDAVIRFFDVSRKSEIASERTRQTLVWFDEMIRSRIVGTVSNHEKVQRSLDSYRKQVANDQLSPTAALQRFMSAFSIDVKELQ